MSRVALAVAISIALACAGCSATQRISESANGIRDEAQALVKHGNAVQDAEVVDRATRIDRMAASIHVDLTNVEDQHPYLTMIVWVAGAAVAVVALIVLWKSGALDGLRILIGWLPRKKVAQAELAVDMLDPSRPEGDREMIAAMRAQDPVFDAAFKQAQLRRKAKT
jgi:hypothetical protein